MDIDSRAEKPISNEFNPDIFLQKLGEIYKQFEFQVEIRGAYKKVDPREPIDSTAKLQITSEEGTFRDLSWQHQRMQSFREAIFEAFRQSFRNPNSISIDELHAGYRQLEKLYPSPSKLEQGGDFLKNIVFPFILKLDLLSLRKDKEKRG